MFSGRDIYPNIASVMSTKDVTSPELSEQLVLTQGDNSQYPGIVTKQDRTHMMYAVVGIIVVLFAFGVVK